MITHLLFKYGLLSNFFVCFDYLYFLLLFCLCYSNLYFAIQNYPIIYYYYPFVKIYFCYIQDGFIKSLQILYGFKLIHSNSSKILDLDHLSKSLLMLFQKMAMLWRKKTFFFHSTPVQLEETKNYHLLLVIKVKLFYCFLNFHFYQYNDWFQIQRITLK